jgi:hypothetical protein
MEPEWNHEINQDDAYILGLRKSNMKIAIVLNKNIDCQYLCNTINSAIQQYGQIVKDMSNSAMIIDFKEISDVDSIPKLDYHEE